MAEKKIRTEYFIVNAPFFYKNDQFFAAGQVIAAGHPVLRGREHLFRPIAPLGARPEPVSAPHSEVAPEPTPESEPEPEP